MNLKSLAHSDLQSIVRDLNGGTSAVTITSPTGETATIQGWVNDIHLSIDPGTDSLVSGRLSTVSFLISDLMANGFEGIKGVPEAVSRPWLVSEININGIAATYKVASANPDNGIGLTVLFLEEYSQ